MKILFRLVLASLLTFQYSYALDSSGSEVLAPTRLQQITTIEVVRKLQINHFEKHSIDDALSMRLLDNYLKVLDPNHLVFNQNEVQDFYKKYGTKLDDALRQGNTEAGFAIFKQYQSKHIALLEKTLASLSAQIKTMDYTKKEDFELDRTKAAWPENDKQIDIHWHDRLKASALSLKLAGKNTDEIISLLEKRYKTQLDRLQKIRNDDVFQLYLNAFTELYDPHTNYLSPASSENFDINMSLKLEGIGAVLSQSDDYTQIVRLIHAGPAQKQGELKPLDKIVAVAQGKDKFVDVVGWRLDEVVKLIRGPKGSTVRLEVIPAKAIANDEHKFITIVRDEVKLEEQSVQKAMLTIKDKQGVERKIGVLDIPAFYIDFEALRKRDPNYKSTTRDTAILLNELIKEGAEGIIIDLRDNGGGSLREANELTGLFIEKGPSVQIRRADNRTYVEAKNFFAPFYDGPMVVLINRMSASASEIFAGAMQDYERAVIAGSRSFGKGTVQSLSDLTYGKIKLTESKFYRISGQSTQHQGVLPDVHLPDLYDETKVGESALEQALPSDKIAALEHKIYYPLQPIIKELSTLSAKRAANDADFQYIKKRTAYEKEHSSNIISLNEKKRLQEREEYKTTMLKLLNEKRVAKGEKPLTALEDEGTEEEIEEKQQAKAAESQMNKIDLEDPFLKEASNILLDMQILLTSKVAKAQ